MRFKLINSKDAHLSAIKNAIRKFDMGIRAASMDGFTSFKMVASTNIALELRR